MRIRRWMWRRGVTVVELMATLVIVSVLAATVGVLIARLFGIQEREREEAYIREKLADACGVIADFVSVGSSLAWSNRLAVVQYRQETGGVSLETSLVSRVAYLTFGTNSMTHALDLNVFGSESGQIVRKLSRTMRGDAHLLPLAGEIIRVQITPLSATPLAAENAEPDAALANLEVAARYEIEDESGQPAVRTAKVERVVRLWNHE
ncbi:MAG: prepilin-type N-terminal cleavage/methylation domain-containing protein [Kiritimatiellia bacterium]